jgi:hypothetical protein
MQGVKSACVCVCVRERERERERERDRDISTRLDCLVVKPFYHKAVQPRENVNR